MDPARAARRVAFGTAITAAAAGVAWQDCLLIAAAIVGAHRLAVGNALDADAEAWRAALRCIVVGLAGLAAAATLAAVAAAGLGGGWAPDHPHRTIGLLLLFALAASLTAARARAGAAWRESRTWLGFGVAVAVAPALADAGVAAAPCLTVTGVAAVLAWHSWKFAHVTASDLLSCGQRHP
jgi:hypothetical protein